MAQASHAVDTSVIQTGKFNQGVSSDVKKRTWANLTARINEISECHREIIEIIKKWSDLKCDTKRKVAAMRASGFSASRISQDLSPVEIMVHQILQMSSPADKFTFRNEDVPDEDEDSESGNGMPQQSRSVANGRQLGFPVLPPPSQSLDMYSSECFFNLTFYYVSEVNTLPYITPFEL